MITRYQKIILLLLIAILWRMANKGLSTQLSKDTDDGLHDLLNQALAEVEK
jgi:hypothetical protein